MAVFVSAGKDLRTLRANMHVVHAAENVRTALELILKAFIQGMNAASRNVSVERRFTENNENIFEEGLYFSSRNEYFKFYI